MSGEIIDEEFVRVHAQPKSDNPGWRELFIHLKDGQSAWRPYPGYENDPEWGPKHLHYEIMPSGTVVCSTVVRCRATSWPSRPGDPAQCVRDYHNGGVHRDAEGNEWNPDE